MDIPDVLSFGWPNCESAWDEGGGITYWSGPQPQPTNAQISAKAGTVGYQNHKAAREKRKRFKDSFVPHDFVEAVLEDRDGNPGPLNALLAEYKKP